MDLSLVPIEDLINEIKARSDFAIVATCKVEDGISTVNTYFTKNKWMSEVGLSSILHNDILNNYNGNMEQLEAMIKEREGGDPDGERHD